MAKRTRQRSKLLDVLGTVETPLFLLSARQEILFFNAGCERLTGWSADDVLGHTCRYATSADPSQIESITGSLAPPPDLFVDRTPVRIPSAQVPVFLTHRNGESFGRLIHFFPLTDIDDDIQGTLGIISPIPTVQPPEETSPARELHAELASLRIALRRQFGRASLICRSGAMMRVLNQIDLACRSDAPVTLVGEDGTGKEHIARHIHYETRADGRPFVPVDCRQLSARELKPILKRLSEGEVPLGIVPDDPFSAPGLRPGTVYLAHVDHLPRDLQEIVVQIFSRSSGEESSGPRLMASCSDPLDQAVSRETICPDLYYMLTVLTMVIPPLRRRREDLEPLAQSLLEADNQTTENQTTQQQIGGFAEEVWQQFREYNWPGNLDELSAVIREARAACTGPTIGRKDLPFRFRTGLDAQAVGPLIRPRVVPLEQLLARIEIEQIQIALEQSSGNKSQAAQLLGLTRPRLYRRMKTLGIADTKL